MTARSTLLACNGQRPIFYYYFLLFRGIGCLFSPAGQLAEVKGGERQPNKQQHNKQYSSLVEKIEYHKILFSSYAALISTINIRAVELYFLKSIDVQLAG